MSAITFSGLATGMDTASIVSQLMEIKKQPIYRLQNDQKSYQAQLTALDSLKTKLLAMQKAAQAIDTATEFASLAATSDNESALGVTAGSTAGAGSYDIQVLALAKGQKDMSQGFDSNETSVGEGTMSFTVNGETTELNLVGFTSLEALKNQINNDVPGVNATLVFDGSTSGGYHLLLSSAEAGSTSAYTIDTSGLSGGTTPTFTNKQLADDASLLVDNLPVTATSNHPTDVISGLTLDLKIADENTTIHVDVSMDTGGISDKVKAMVDSYNDLFSFITTQGGKDGTLHGNPALNAVTSRVENLFVSSLSGGLGDVTNFFQAGITRGDSHQLVFNANDFATAIGKDFSGVRDLFIEREGNLGKMYLLSSSITDMTDSHEGLFKISTDSLNRKISYADDTIARYQRSVDSYQKTMQAKFTAMESMVAQLQSQGNYLSAFTNSQYSA